MSTTSLKNLLFDLGGVLYRLNFDRMFGLFDQMRLPGSPQVLFTKEKQHPIFLQMDVGAVDAQAFANGLKEEYNLQGEAEDVLTAWNSLLDGEVPGVTDTLKGLKEQYNLALLSNTNQFHHGYFTKASPALFAQFAHCFYSFEMGVRKPGAEIYQQVLTTMDWKAEETLFIDDTRSNVDAAAQLGIQIFWMETEENWEQLKEMLG